MGGYLAWLEIFDPVTETFTHYTPHPPGNTEWSNHITSILQDRPVF